MREAKRAALFAPTIFRGHSSASQSGCFTCIRSKARFLLPSPFLSLWCSPDNMPASHAGDHRSEAGQGRQFLPPKHLERCTPLVWESARCNSGWGSSFVPVRKHRSRASAQASIISPLRPGPHWGLRPSNASMQQPAGFFCKETVPGQHRLEDPCSRSPIAETRR